MNTIAELCSGYGGLGLACDAVFGPLERLWHAEIDPQPDLVYKRHHDGSRNIGDITVHDWALPVPDVLAMGVPCQTVSVAGQRGGDDDERWLWPYALAALTALRPAALVFENVRGLVRFDEGRLWRGILHDMHRAGYRVRWTVIGACSVGACHHRHRVFAYGTRTDTPALPEHVPSITCGAPETGGRDLLPTPLSRDSKGEGGDTGHGGPDLGRAVLLLPSPQARDGGERGDPSPARARARAQAGHAIGQADAMALLPTPMARDERTIGPGDLRRNDPCIAAEVLLLPTPQARDGHADAGGVTSSAAAQRRIDDGRQPNLVDAVSLLQPDRWGRYAPAVALHAHVFGAPPPEPTELGPKGGRRLAAALPEWMMGLPGGYLTGELDRRPALKAAGNGVMPQQAAAAIHVLQSAPSDLLF